MFLWIVNNQMGITVAFWRRQRYWWIESENHVFFFLSTREGLGKFNIRWYLLIVPCVTPSNSAISVWWVVTLDMDFNFSILSWVMAFFGPDLKRRCIIVICSAVWTNNKLQHNRREHHNYKTPTRVHLDCRIFFQNRRLVLTLLRIHRYRAFQAARRDVHHSARSTTLLPTEVFLIRTTICRERRQWNSK